MKPSHAADKVCELRRQEIVAAITVTSDGAWVRIDRGWVPVVGALFELPFRCL